MASCPAETVLPLWPQAARVFMDELARHKIEVVSAPGEAIHIDWVNTTAATPEDLVQQASKTYLDWHMLTQVRAASMPLRAKSRREQPIVAPQTLQLEHGSGVYLAQHIALS